MKTIYYDKNVTEHQPGFRGGGQAWWISSDRETWDEHAAKFTISQQLYVGMFHLGIVDDFLDLPHDGLLDAYEEGILLLSGLRDASQILRRKAENLYKGTYEWDCGMQFSPEKIQYKMLVDASELKQELLSLADFLDGASSKGFDVQLWL